MCLFIYCDVCIYIYVYREIGVYIYIYIHTYIYYTCVYIYIYIERERYSVWKPPTEIQDFGGISDAEKIIHTINIAMSTQ